MSTPFYDLASLVVVPSGYKASKVYAQKPLTTDGQLTFSRASTATRVNSAGLIETVSSNVPRLDYLNSSCPRLLLEPQRTNLVTFSEQLNNSVAWGSAGITMTANQAVSPDGYTNADLIVGPASANYSFQGLTGPFSGTYTVSIFAKKGTESSFAFGLVGAGFTGGMGVKFNFDTQTFSTPANYGNFTSMSASYQSYGNGWYRLNLTGTTATSTTYFFVLGSLLEAFAVNAYVYGAQAEEGAYATSYIPTTSALVTRLADAASKTGISSLIGQTEGTLFAVIKSQQAGSTYNWLNLTDGTTSNWVFIGKDGTKWRNYVRAGGAVIFDNSATTISDNTDTKIALAYKSGQIALYINGTQIATSSTTFTFGASLSQFIIGTIGAAVGERSLYSQTLLFKTRLTNAQLAELTTL